MRGEYTRCGAAGLPGIPYLGDTGISEVGAARAAACEFVQKEGGRLEIPRNLRTSGAQSTASDVTTVCVSLFHLIDMGSTGSRERSRGCSTGSRRNPGDCLGTPAALTLMLAMPIYRCS